jgi:hypothetical protein
MIGDQLHPAGRIDQDVYDLIGEVYAEVEEKEPWCEGAKAVTEIAVLHPEEFIGKGHRNLPQLSRASRACLRRAGTSLMSWTLPAT